VQQLFEQSFLTSDIKLKEVPSCLIIQMPRFGKNYKMYPRILPSQVLDVTDIIEDCKFASATSNDNSLTNSHPTAPRQCTICGTLAEYECRDCFGALQVGSGLESTAFCKKCLTTVHSHQKRVSHKAKPLSIPHDFKIMAEFNQVPRLFMELFAVICIETSHYVAFVKSGSGLDSPWVFFDSMADRKGERDGYNIPSMVPVPDLPTWLSEDGARTLHEANINDKHLPEFAKRLYCDAYLMLYQSTEMMMYR
jgi:ubiquitin carboxyl-terminal hydrolase CYLD